MLNKVLLSAAFTCFFIHTTDAAVCVRYNVVGDTGCQDGEKQPEEDMQKNEEPQQQLPEPTPQATPASIPLDQKVQQYLDDYGKPPREYVRFMLEPTLENAMLWAQKYEEMQARSGKLADAWRQAEDIIAKRKEQGLDLPVYQQLPEVPDFNKTPVENWGIATQEMQKNSAEDDVLNFNRVDENTIRRDITPLKDGRIGGDDTSETETVGPIQMSYYFSADCPFCQKFEPQFQRLITMMGDQLDVTCIDLTPSGRKEENILGKVSCRWRPVVSGEMKAFGIQSTPTLLINKAGKLTKVEGAVDMAKLYGFLTQ